MIWPWSPVEREDEVLGHLTHRGGSWRGNVTLEAFGGTQVELEIVDGKKADLSAYHPLVAGLKTGRGPHLAALLDATFALYQQYAQEDDRHTYEDVASPEAIAQRMTPSALVLDERAYSDWALVFELAWPNPHNRLCATFMGEELVDLEPV